MTNIVKKYRKIINGVEIKLLEKSITISQSIVGTTTPSTTTTRRRREILPGDDILQTVSRFSGDTALRKEDFFGIISNGPEDGSILSYDEFIDSFVWRQSPNVRFAIVDMDIANYNAEYVSRFEAIEGNIDAHITENIASFEIVDGQLSTINSTLLGYETNFTTKNLVATTINSSVYNISGVSVIRIGGLFCGTTQVGTLAGQFNTGNYQYTIGYKAGRSNSGDHQIAVGYQSGYLNSATDQVAIGHNSGYDNTGAYSNSLGFDAGHTNSGDYQNAIGMYAGKGNTATNQVAVGFQAGQLNAGTHQVAVGYNAGSGNTSNGDYQIAVGYYAGYSNTATTQTAIGSSAGYGNGGTYQNTIGRNSGYGNKGDYQIAVGENAGYGNKGDYQIAIGENAGNINSATTQIAIGRDAGYSNSGSNQISIGYQAGHSNTATTQIAIGYQAGLRNKGTYQTAIGYRAGSGNTGNNCIFLGYNAGYANTLPNQFIVKQNTTPTAIPLLQGNLATNFLGINKTDPQCELDVDGSISATTYSGITYTKSITWYPPTINIIETFYTYRSLIIKRYSVGVEGTSVTWRISSGSTLTASTLVVGPITTTNTSGEQSAIIDKYIPANSWVSTFPTAVNNPTDGFFLTIEYQEI